ncbi:MAG: hypothetical protein Q7U02_09810, partial [Desulfosalsimonadaceae bacterium]|nr:hypothetical protein [Desulfosalsimonadaceae bacterium]
LNPDVKDIDLIYPGQRIMIPLKLIEPGTLEGQALGTVTIPLITITNIPAQIQKNSTNYVVMQGDSVSLLISRTFGRHSTRPYKEALEIFKYLNPQIKDLNLIRAGQTIQLPTQKVMDASWYPELFDRSGKLVVGEKPPAADVKPPVKKPVKKFKPVPVTVPKEVRITITPQPQPSPKALPAKQEPIVSESRPFVPKPVIIPAPATPPAPVAPTTAKAVAAPVAKKGLVKKPETQKTIKQAPVEARKPLPSIFKKAAGIFNADLLDTGEYFFPRTGNDDLRVDLSATPVMEFPSGFRLLFAKRNALSAPDQKVISAFWKNVGIITLSYDAPVRELLSAICREIDPGGCENHVAVNDNGVAVSVRGDFIFDAVGSGSKTCVTLIDGEDQRMSDPIRRYLNQKQIVISEWIDSESFFGAVGEPGGKTMTRPFPMLRLSFDAGHPAGFVKDFAAALGLRYQEKVEITFPYAGFQVKAYANLLSVAQGREVLVDFGDLQGDAIKSIEATGFRVLQIKPQQGAESIIDALLNQLPAQQQENPVFWAAERSESHNTSLQIPGRLISLATDHGQRGLLLTDLALNENLLAFLAQAGVQAARINDHY